MTHFEPCDGCPISPGSATPCHARATDHRRFCELIASGRDDYRAVVIRLTAGDPPPEPIKIPGPLARAGNLARAVVAHVADQGRHASPEVQAEREAICRACPNLDQERDVCNLCGCLAMKLKRSWASSACPDSPPRWGAVP